MKSIRRAVISTLSVVLVGVGLVALASAPHAADAQGRLTRTPRPTRTLIPRTPISAGSGAVATNISGTAYANTTRIAGTVTANAALRAPTLTALATRFDPVDPAQAALAVQTYAQSVLGAAVVVKSAGGFSGDIARSIEQTAEGAEAQFVSVTLATVNYAASLQNGAATLSYGAGTLSGDLTIDVQNASLGVYALRVAGNAGDPDSALALALATYPGLAGPAYTPYPTARGYAWSARTTVTTIDPATRRATATAQTVLLYILPSASTPGQASVTAAVGRGNYATTLP
jgi:hypothetical protein